MPTWLPAALRLGHGYQMTSAKRLTPHESTLHARIRELDNADTDMVLNEEQWVWAIDRAIELAHTKVHVPKTLAAEVRLHVCSKLWRHYIALKELERP